MFVQLRSELEPYIIKYSLTQLDNIKKNLDNVYRNISGENLFTEYNTLEQHMRVLDRSIAIYSHQKNKLHMNDGEHLNYIKKIQKQVEELLDEVFKILIAVHMKRKLYDKELLVEEPEIEEVQYEVTDNEIEEIDYEPDPIDELLGAVENTVPNDLVHTLTENEPRIILNGEERRNDFLLTQNEINEIIDEAHAGQLTHDLPDVEGQPVVVVDNNLLTLNATNPTPAMTMNLNNTSITYQTTTGTGYMANDNIVGYRALRREDAIENDPFT
jgi:hypothetical protein